MKISELIQHLTVAMEKHGDLEVVYNGDEYCGDYYYGVSGANVRSVKKLPPNSDLRGEYQSEDCTIGELVKVVVV